MERVCANCIGDADLRRWIRKLGGKRGCDFCGLYTSPTVELDDFCDYLEQCLSRYYGHAVEQLPWNGKEGGYLGRTWSADEIIFDRVGLELPHDSDSSLQAAITWQLSDEIWCEYDWLRLDDDQALTYGWENFCETVKHQRRFFFHEKGGRHEDSDSYSALDILTAIAELAQSVGLIRIVPPGLRLYRARPGFTARRVLSSDFGPPPKTVCQSNRMNPAGVPMFYGALDPKTAVKEVKETESRVGYFITAGNFRILDLTSLPSLPGFFSDSSRRYRLSLKFMQYFVQDIMRPVARDDRVHVEYIPSQVVTEFLREYSFVDGKVDGVMYGSVVSPGKTNLVLFLDDIEPRSTQWGSEIPAPLIFIKARNVKVG